MDDDLLGKFSGSETAVKQNEIQQFRTCGPSIFNGKVNIRRDQWHFFMPEGTLAEAAPTWFAYKMLLVCANIDTSTKYGRSNGSN